MAAAAMTVASVAPGGQSRPPGRVVVVGLVV